MRKNSIIHFTGALAFAALSLAACAGSGKGTWEVVKTLKSFPEVNGSNAGLQVAFEDDTRGAALNGGNHFFATANGGATWEETAINTSPCLRGPEIVDSDTFFVGCECNSVKRSADGGKTWSPLKIESYPMISMVDASTGFMAKARSLLAVTGDLNAPVALAIPADTREIIAIAALGPGNLLFLDKSGVIRFTGNGGETWALQGSLEAGKYALEKQMTALRFKNANEGMIAAYEIKKGAWKALRTADGGKTWKAETILERGLGNITISRNLDFITIVPISGADKAILLRKKS